MKVKNTDEIWLVFCNISSPVKVHVNAIMYGCRSNNLELQQSREVRNVLP